MKRRFEQFSNNELVALSKNLNHTSLLAEIRKELLIRDYLIKKSEEINNQKNFREEEEK